MIVRGQSRVSAKPALFDEVKPAAHVEIDESGVGGPGVHRPPDGGVFVGKREHADDGVIHEDAI